MEHRWFNVFACVAVNGRVSVWAHGKRYATEDDARVAAMHPPDCNFVYLRSIQTTRPLTVEILGPDAPHAWDTDLGDEAN